MYTVHYSKIIIKITAIYHEMYRKTRYYMKYFVFYFVFPANFMLCRGKSIISGTVYAVPKIIWISARKPSLSEQMQRYMSGFCAWYACVQIKKPHTYRCFRSWGDWLGFYAEIRIILGQCTMCIVPDIEWTIAFLLPYYGSCNCIPISSTQHLDA